MYDVTICTNESEEIVEQESESIINNESDESNGNNENNENSTSESSEKISVTMYAYDGNQFRTVYEITEDEILADLDKYLNYDASNEPTQDQLEHDNALIDKYTLELIENEVIS